MRATLILLLCLLHIVAASTHNSHRHGSHAAFQGKNKQTPVEREGSLMRRASSNEVDDYTCGPDKPCKNKACCGNNNVCGYGDLYCGKGCQSNCDAKAECGRDSASGAKLCPLNICCSQFGFCGTTDDFCGTGCQSNCNDPSKPSPGVQGDVRNRLIGYYESWRGSGQACGMMAPEEIPVEYLDQINLAFLYIDPKDYHIIAMDEPVGTDLYTRVADVKTRNPRAKVWISIGGWTFNDEGIYQSVFTKLASDTRAAATFSSHLVSFMQKYGFDGVDIDWEYPGAEDRGGRAEDVENFPKLLTTVRRALSHWSKGPRLSITVPTSYWYLRWFDVKALSRVVDEFNVMAYDLHGKWDRDDPIGPYIYAHTNLTEIDDALDLFWRNGIDAGQINLGLAFYGRTYTLSTPLCADPGCEWSDPGPKGPCTGTAGILSYKEIQDIIKEGELKPVYDEDAGVYYVTYGKGGGNWVSFDDPISFTAKIDLANKYGLGGLLIWAIDQDDEYYNALRAVTGKDVLAVPQSSDGYGAFDIDECYITECNERCKAGDNTMTRLNEDASGRGCGSKYHTARSFCCPARNAPQADTCYWTGGPTNCHGQCAAGEVSMVLDDYGDSGKRCTNGGKKVWCCPATNGQEAIQRCQLSRESKECPSELPQEMTTVATWSNRPVWGRPDQYKFCCPAKPDYGLGKCGWYGENKYCNDNVCPLGEVELYKWNGWHQGLDRGYRGCNKGRKHVFCCQPPLSEGSAFLPVPLEDLFPTADSFLDSYTTTFAQDFDLSADETYGDYAGNDPNINAFDWIVMVGEAEDVQSFEKRDGSHLELFDCPNTKADDFSIQNLRAACMGGSEDSSNCEDIHLGGVEGTVVRLPSHCGPDAYVRAVKFERSANLTLPGHLSKRRESPKVYDFHYDYEFSNLRRGGGEVYFRADVSTHPGYWNYMVKAKHEAPAKRSADNWRELDRRYWSESKSDWLTRFKALLERDNTGLKKHFEFNECLFQTSAVCGNADATMEARVYGELNTTMDIGMSLIGTLRNFGFSEAYSFFSQEAFSMRMGSAFRARARMYMDSGWVSVGSFDDFGMNSHIKGIFTFNPSFKMDVRLEAEAYVSAQATTEMTISHDRFEYLLPVELGDNPTSVTGDFNFDTVTGPISGFGNIDARAGGGLVFSFSPTIGVDIGVQLGKRKYVDTKLSLSTPSSIRYDAAITTGCSAGLQFDVTGQMGMTFSIDNGLPGWRSGSYPWETSSPKTIWSGCVPFSVLVQRSLEGKMAPEFLLPRSTPGSTVNIPEASLSTCAISAKGVYCADPENGEHDCDLNTLYEESDFTGDEESSLMKRGDVGKRGAKSLSYCTSKADPDIAGFGVGAAIKFSNFPSSGPLLRKYPDVATYDAEDPKDCMNLNLIKLPQTPTASKDSNGRSYDTEHVLEGQTVQRFFNDLGRKWSALKKPNDTPNPNARIYPNPKDKDAKDVNWCTYMKLWWERSKWNANNQLGGEFPGTYKHTEEFVLYESVLNQNVKQGWFGGTRPYHLDEIESHATNGDWDEFSKVLKVHILAWQYYYFQEIKDVLVKQAHRIEAKLRSLEDGDIQLNVGPASPPYIKPYIPQGLAELWKVWVEAEHERVQMEMKKFLKDWAQKGRDRNRPQPKANEKLAPGEAVQSDTEIIKRFEYYLKFIDELKPWNIDWKWDGDSGGDPMDTS